MEPVHESVCVSKVCTHRVVWDPACGRDGAAAPGPGNRIFSSGCVVAPTWGDWGPSSGVTACFAVGGGVEGKPQQDFKDHKLQRALHSLLS